jgi:hypothetical protein
MRPLVLALAALAATGCVVYETRPYRPMPPPSEAGPPPQGAPPAAGAQLMPEQDAVNLAFETARERGLRVDRVQRAHLDGEARWHVDVRGAGGDRALLLIDARSGKLLRGKFRERGRSDEPGDD